MTVRDRILLHLLEHPYDADAIYAPPECTAKIMCELLDVDRGYLSHQLTRLAAEGCIGNRVLRVRGGDRRTSTYYLTERGMLRARSLR